jgi:hypothetical protein
MTDDRGLVCTVRHSVLYSRARAGRFLRWSMSNSNQQVWPLRCDLCAATLRAVLCCAFVLPRLLTTRAHIRLRLNECVWFGAIEPVRGRRGLVGSVVIWFDRARMVWFVRSGIPVRSSHGLAPPNLWSPLLSAAIMAHPFWCRCVQ